MRCEHALGAGALDPHSDAGILRLEGLAELLGERQVHGGVEDDLAFFLRRLDQRRRDRPRPAARRRRAPARRTLWQAASAVEPFENVASGECLFCAHPRPRCPHTLNSLRVARLDLFAVFSTPAASSFIVLMSLNGLRPGFSLTCGCTERKPPTSKMSCWHSGVKQQLWNSRAAFGLGAFLNRPFGPIDQRRAFGRIDGSTGWPASLSWIQIVLVAVGHDRALAERELLRRIGRRLHLHDLLLRELLEIVPAEVARDLEGRGHDGAAVARMRLDDLAGPFRIEQVGEALRRLLGLHQIGVVADRRPSPRGSSRTARRRPCARPDNASRHPPARRAPASPSRFQTMKCAASDGVHHVDGVDAARRTPGRCAGTRVRRRCARPARRCRDISPRRPWRSSRRAAGRSRCNRRPCLPSWPPRSAPA